MFASSFRSGISGLRARPGLVFLLFGLKLIFSVVIAVPIATWLSSALSGTGFDADLSQAFDVVLWADLFEAGGDAYPTVISQLTWALPLFLLWSVASRVGLVQALRDGGVRSFWSGVARYTGKGLLLALLFLVLIAGWLIVTAIVAYVGNKIISGEVAGFWFNFVGLPTFAIIGLSSIDLMHDYGRAALVIDERPVKESWLYGIRFGYRHPVAAPLYIVWFVLGLAAMSAPTVIEAVVGATVLVFLFQQVLMLARTAVTVGWIGSEVALYENVRLRDMPTIAADSGLDATDSVS